MQIRSIRAITGPNIYHSRPVLLMRLDVGDLAERDSASIPGFIEGLTAALPGLHEHHCSPGWPGGFVERLHRGTYAGHIVEHVALELSDLADIGVNYGKTRYGGQPGLYEVVVRYQAEQGMRFLLETAVELVDALVAGEPFDVAERLAKARRIIARTELGPSTKAIVDAARQRRIPTVRLNGASLVQLGYGRHRKYIQAAMAESTSAIAMEIASDKELTKQLLDRVSVPVPQGVTVDTEEDAIAALGELGGPVVVKPLDGNQGRGVTVNLTTPEEVAAAFQIAQRHSDDVLVEEFYAGTNYRVLVVNGRMVAANERLAANVTGDGEHTIAQLIEIANQDPRRGEGHQAQLTKLEADAVVLTYLAKCGRTLGDVPAAGETVFLRESANLSTGGTAKDVMDAVHPTVRRACERAARVIGLDICGIDLVMEDISRPLREGGGIIELNAAPGLRMHLYPSEGTPRDVGAAIVDMLYPPGTPSRIPIISITGTSGKTTVTRMAAHIMARTGVTVDMTTTEGIYIDGELIVEGDTSGPASAQTVLSDPSVDVAVLETARGGMVRAGLGYDWSDVGVITNIQLDHVGQGGIEGTEDLIEIKSLVAERVREGGTLVLNADDEHAAGVIEIPRIKRLRHHVVYFSVQEDNPRVREHVGRGGTAYFLRDGWLVEAMRRQEHRLVRAARIPVTLGGAADFHIANAAAAIAACRAAGASARDAVEAMIDFRAEVHNAGRANLYRVAAGYVLTDFGHNPHAFEAIARMAARWHGPRVTAIISVPGDRADWLIEEAGRVAARGFDRVIVRADADLRGRRPGEVPEILCRAVTAEVPHRECNVVLDEIEALRTAISEMQENELVVLFFEHDLPPALAVLQECGAVPATEAEMLEPFVTLDEPETDVDGVAAKATPPMPAGARTNGTALNRHVPTARGSAR